MAAEATQGNRLPWHLDGGETLATDTAAIAQGSPPALGGLAVQEAMLPFAANLRRLILSFHNAVSKNRGRCAAACPKRHRDEISRCTGAARLTASSVVSSAPPRPRGGRKRESSHAPMHGALLGVVKFTIKKRILGRFRRASVSSTGACALANVCLRTREFGLCWSAFRE